MVLSTAQPVAISLFDQYVSANTEQNIPNFTVPTLFEMLPLIPFFSSRQSKFYSHRIFASWILNSFVLYPYFFLSLGLVLGGSNIFMDGKARIVVIWIRCMQRILLLSLLKLLYSRYMGIVYILCDWISGHVSILFPIIEVSPWIVGI
jgi:hypothetical protein